MLSRVSLSGVHLATHQVLVDEVDFHLGGSLPLMFMYAI